MPACALVQIRNLCTIVAAQQKGRGVSAVCVWLHQVAREGTKKTVFTNFLELCKAMNRQLEHVQAFLLAELGTSGNLDGQSRLVVKGRFLPKAFEGVLRRYVNECVHATVRMILSDVVSREL